MSNYVCGWCGTLAPRKVVWNPTGDGKLGHPDGEEEQVPWFLLECAACRRPSLDIHDFGQMPGVWQMIDVSDAPQAVQDDYKEAVRCKKANASRATATMARRSVQSACVDLGANPKERLFDQITYLHKEGEFSNRLANLAHQVRFFGNDGAHPGSDGLDDVTADEAALAIRFLQHLIQHVYILDKELDGVQGEE